MASQTRMSILLLELCILWLYIATVAATSSDQVPCLEGDAGYNRTVVSMCFNTTDVKSLSCSTGLLLLHRVTYGATRDGSCFNVGERNVTCSFDLSHPAFPLVPCPTFPDLTDGCTEIWNSYLPDGLHNNVCGGKLDFVQVEYSCYSQSSFVSTGKRQNKMMSEGFLLSPKLAGDTETPRNASTRCELYFETGGFISPFVDLTAVHLNLTGSQTLTLEEQFSRDPPLVLQGNWTNGTRFNSSARPHILVTFDAAGSSNGDFAVFFKAEVPLRVECGPLLPPVSMNDTAKCVKGWIEHDGICYKVADIRNQYRATEARAACRACGADLVNVRSDDQLNWIADNILGDDYDYASLWTGRTKLSQKSKTDKNLWIFTDGSPAEPLSNTFDERCSELHNYVEADPYIEVDSCYLSSYSPICAGTAKRLLMYKNDSTRCGNTGIVFPESVPFPALDIRDDPLCPKGWRRMTGGTKCYLFVNDRQVNWTAALDYCNNQNGTLLSITSLEELNYLRVVGENMVIQNKALNVWWTGLHLTNDNYTWWWTTGDRVKGSINATLWDSGEPDRRDGIEGCAQLRHTGGFNDIRCSDAETFICERLIDTSSLMSRCAAPEPPTTLPTTSASTPPSTPSNSTVQSTATAATSTAQTPQAVTVRPSHWKGAAIGFAVAAILLFFIGVIIGATRKTIFKKCCSCCGPKEYDTLLLQKV